MSEPTNAVPTLEAPPEPPRPRHSRLAGVLTALPNLVVLAALGGLGYWGHHTGWAFPRFSALAGGAAAAPDDWCAAHGVPESRCVECNPELLPREREFGWCKAHGVPNCPWEHPEVAQLSAPPAVTPADLARAERALAAAGRPANSRKCKLRERRIQFASARAMEKAGVDVAPAWRGPVAEAVAAAGEVSYDPGRVARLSARAPGSVWWVGKQVGDPVWRGEVVALVDAARVGEAKAEFLQALVQVGLRARALEGLRTAGGRGSVPEVRVQEAEASLREAEIRLATAEQALVNLGLPARADEMRGLAAEEMAARVRFLGLPPELAGSLDPRATTANLLPVRAPFDGEVVAREAVAGEVVDTARVLFTVADVRRMWLTLGVRLEDARKLRPGQPVRFRPDGDAEETGGAVAWVSTAADEKTRTVRVRAELDNPGRRLRDHTFGTGRVILREEPEAVLVPSEAVHWEGDCHVVFVRDRRYDPRDPDGLLVFHVRPVRPGARTEAGTEVIAGVLPGEVVAARGSGALRAELLKNNLGEG
jgi:cobalt-zinc-cadmium efflux system membrane fusion protein